jgi:hypothetical protein
MIRIYGLKTLVFVLFAASAAVSGQPAPAQSREYIIKAAFLYNLAKFVDWPENKATDNNDVITIGIVGKDPFGNAIDPIEGKQVKGRKLLFKKIQGPSQLPNKSDDDKAKLREYIEQWRKCQIVFICSSEKRDFQEIIKSFTDYHVLTVGEMDKFIESGGILNLIPNEQKVVFEVNLVAARRAKLRISSEVLRLAKRIIKDESESSESGKN